MSENRPILYSYWRSSCSWRVRIALAFKNINYETRTVNLLKSEQLEEEFKSLNPMGHVPTFIVDDHIITQSLSILEYLEEKYPELPLLPKDLILRAKVREICSIIASGIQPLQNLCVLKRVGDEGKMQWAHDFIQTGLDALERILSASSGKYCVGDEVTLADCCLVPQIYNAVRFNVDVAHFPTVKRVNENLVKLEAFIKAHPSTQPDCPSELK